MAEHFLTHKYFGDGDARMQYELYNALPRNLPIERQILLLLVDTRRKESVMASRSSWECLRLLLGQKIVYSHVGEKRKWQVVDAALYQTVVQDLDRRLNIVCNLDDDVSILAPEVIAALGPNFPKLKRVSQVISYLNTIRTLRAIFLKNAIAVYINMLNCPNSWFRVNRNKTLKGRAQDLLGEKINQIQNLSHLISLDNLSGRVRKPIARYLQLLVWTLMEDESLTDADSYELINLESRIHFLLGYDVDSMFSFLSF